jgi:hypothetical protein
VSRQSAPFVGAAAFAEGDAPFFFGRSAAVAVVSAKLLSSRLTVLYGPSGAGKSSLLNAGVVPRLREEAERTQDETAFTVCVVREWRGDAVHVVQEAARDALQELAGEEPLAAAGATLAETLRAWTARAGTLLLVLDQFEEYLLHHPDSSRDTLTGFGAELVRIVRSRGLHVHVLLSLREDAWGALDRFEGHIPAGAGEHVRLDQLDRDAAREAIEGPVFAWNRTLAPGAEPFFAEGALVDALLAPGGDTSFPAAGGDGVETMLLQLVLERVWRKTIAGDDHVLRLARLESLGPKRIVERHVGRSLGRLSRRDQVVAAACFRYLATHAKTNAAYTAADLSEWTRRAEPDIAGVLETLSSRDGGRLLRPVALAGGVTGYELFNDAFADHVVAWRRSHDVARRSETRQRLARFGTAGIALLTLLAGVTAWALVDRSNANHHYHSAQAANRALETRILRLTAAQRAARRAAAAQRVVARRLTGQNAGLTVQTTRLLNRRSRLDTQIANLRAGNAQDAAAIKRYNAWNTALVSTINGLDKIYDGLGPQALELQGQAGLLKHASATLTAELAVQKTALEALQAQKAQLAPKAAALGLTVPATSVTAAKTATPKPTTSKQVSTSAFGIVVDVPASDSGSHRVAVLEQELALLSEQRAQPATTVRWLRQENVLLAARRDALLQEVEQLQGTRSALQSRNSQLNQTRTQAAAAHKTLAGQAAADQKRNGARAKQIAALQKSNVGLQSGAAKQIAALATLQDEVAAATAQNKALVTSLEPKVAGLSTAAQRKSTDPQLAGLLALQAYRLTPYGADDPLHPEVYDALWSSLQRLDQQAATKLAAKTGKPTSSATLVKTLCGRINRGLTLAEWFQYLPAGAAYSAAAARPC